MLLAVQPVLPEAGVPPIEEMNRYADSMAGLGSWTDFLQGTITTTLNKIQLPGFGTPKYEPGTVITTPTGSVVKQETGYPVSVPTKSTGFDISTGAGIMMAGAAVFVGLMFLSRGGGK